ncbi:hypothetical protein 015DV004_257 [Bacillus phage 015DV004]|nr:hypothetical protein 015DV004_257 [Bacillus phage 015DV004]
MKFKELRDHINELWDSGAVSDEADVYFDDNIGSALFDHIECIRIDGDNDLVLMNAIPDEED